MFTWHGLWAMQRRAPDGPEPKTVPLYNLGCNGWAFCLPSTAAENRAAYCRVPVEPSIFDVPARPAAEPRIAKKRVVERRAGTPEAHPSESPVGLKFL